MKKTDETVEKTWVMTTDPVPNEPEDHGRPYFSLPFAFRLRFAVNAFHYKEPAISFYEDTWSNDRRCWVQTRAPFSIGLSVLRNFMKLLEEELEK